MSNEYNVVEIPIGDVWADPDFNCRGEAVSPHEVDDLAKDIETNGLLAPITIQPYKHNQYKYRIVVGHRRHRAYLNLRRKTIPCFIKENLNEHSAGVLNLAENMKRKDLNILQEAKAVEKLYKLQGYTINEAAAELNVSPGWVQVRYTLVELPYEIQQEAAAGYLTQSNIKDLYNLSREQQFEAVAKIKDAKVRNKNKSISVNKSKRGKGKQKKARNVTEINRMQDYVYDNLGPSLVTVLLGWAGGNVNNEDAFSLLKSHIESEDKIFEFPPWYD